MSQNLILKSIQERNFCCYPTLKNHHITKTRHFFLFVYLYLLVKCFLYLKFIGIVLSFILHFPKIQYLIQLYAHMFETEC